MAKTILTPKPELIAILPALYKQTKHGIIEWKIWVVPVGQHADMITEYGYIGGKFQQNVERITCGKNAGRRNETTPFQQANSEAQSRWNKQKDRKGYGLTPVESQTVRSVSPMLAKVFEKEATKIQWDKAFAQPKLDGFRALACRSKLPDGNLGPPIISSRENQPLIIRHVAAALDQILPKDKLVIFDGELFSPKLSLNKISSACKKEGPLTAQIGYHIYDLHSAHDFGSRHTMLHQYLAAADDVLREVETVKVSNREDLMVCQREFIDRGYEGAMLRYSDAGYEAGVRSSHLLKVKTFVSGEFVIIDYKMGRGKYEGVPIFTCVTQAGHHFDVTAQGTMEEKREQGQDAALMVGRVLEVKYACMTKTDEPVPFQPVAMRFRGDIERGRKTNAGA